MDNVELDFEEYVCNEMQNKEPWTEQNGRLSWGKSRPNLNVVVLKKK